MYQSCRINDASLNTGTSHNSGIYLLTILCHNPYTGISGNL